MGIMKPHWNEHDLGGIAWHQLTFMPTEAEHLRSLVQRLRNSIPSATDNPDRNAAEDPSMLRYFYGRRP